MGSRVAFFGGSFDPPHAGHLAIARTARESLKLDTVLFAPVGIQPLKPSGSTAAFSDRTAMTSLAIADEPGFVLSLADAPAENGKPNYTIDTLHKLHAQLAAGAILFCLMGADSFRSLHRWHRAAEIPFAAPLIVASRPGQPLDDLAAMMPEGVVLQPGASAAADLSQGSLEIYTVSNAVHETAPFYVLPGVQVDISASQIREQLHGYRTQPNPLVDPAVASYIDECRLYRTRT
jgi:nicotinate-nucleotide adenylyltransferase